MFESTNQYALFRESRWLRFRQTALCSGLHSTSLPGDLRVKRERLPHNPFTLGTKRQLTRHWYKAKMDKGAADKDLDNLIFSDNKEQKPTEPKSDLRRTSTDDGEQPTSQNNEEEVNTTRKSKFDRASLVNVLPVDKLKNGANTASKVFGQTFTMVKEKTSAAYETAKTSKAGTAIASGVNSVAAAGSEQINKVKETEAYKKAASTASSAVEKTTVVASIAAEKAKATASVGLEKAKSGAQSGIDTIKSKVGSSDKKD